MSDHKRIVDTLRPTLFLLEHNPQRLMWLAQNTSWLTPAWMVPWGEGPAPELPRVSFRENTYLGGLAKMEQIKTMDEARLRLNDWCIKLIKKDIENRKEKEIESFFNHQNRCPSPANVGIETFLHLWDIYLTVAELSMEIKRDLMQDMLTTRFWGEEVGFECIISGPMTVVFGPKKFSKYFRITATF